MPDRHPSYRDNSKNQDASQRNPIVSASPTSPASLTSPVSPQGAFWRDRPAQVAGILTLVSLLNFGLLCLYYIPAQKSLIGDEGYYLYLAQQIAAGQVVEHHPFWPPLYAEAMGRLSAVVGLLPLSWQLVQILMWLLTGLVYADIGWRLFGSQRIATLILLLFFLSPELMAFSHFLWPEIPHLFFFGLAVWLLIHPSAGWFRFGLAGVLLGLAVLTKSLLVPFLPLLVLFVVWVLPDAWPARIGKAMVLSLMLIVTVLPMVLENSRQHALGASGVFNLWVGLNDVGRQDYKNELAGPEKEAFEAYGTSFIERNTHYQHKIADFVEKNGLLTILSAQLAKQYFRLFHAATFFTTQLPGGPRQAYHFPEWPLAPLLRGGAYLMHGLVLGLAALGLSCLRLRPVGWLHLLVFFVLYNLGVFLFIHVKTRYVIQFLPVLMIFASLAVDRLLGWWSGSPDRLPPSTCWSRWRLGLGGVLALVVEGLAFRGLG